MRSGAYFYFLTTLSVSPVQTVHNHYYDSSVKRKITVIDYAKETFLNC